VSESWTFRDRTTTPAPRTTQPYTIPNVPCVPATLRYSSRDGTGLRFRNAISEQVRSFRLFKLYIETTRENFRCECLQRCQDTQGCRAAFMQAGKIGYLCYGLTAIGLEKSTSIVSESWVLN
jgi:predicted metal-binding protein